MYGTIARFKMKPGMEQKLKELMQADEQLKVPGFVNSFVYRMDNDSNEYYLAVMFTDKGSYTKNADSPDQNKRYQEFAALMDGEPEWHDGEIVYNMA